ncbi:MAG: carboxypeptidase-like regulatory domain-containing protein [Chloroflexota bacterium]
MRYRLAALLLVLGVAGCGGSKAATGNAGVPKPTINSHAPVVDTAPVPKTSPVTAKLPTANPHATAARLPTLKPVPTATVIPASAYSAKVSGRVTSAKTGKAIRGATVIVGSGLRTGKTDAHGRYQVAFPAGPSESVTVRAHGYSGALAMGILKKHKAMVLNFALHPKGAGKSGIPSPPVIFPRP